MTVDKKQVSIYLLVGASTALAELLLFQVLYYFSGDTSISNVIAVVVMTLVNFCINGTVTFQQSTNPIASLVKYLVLFCFNTVFSTFVIAIGANLGFPAVLVKLCTMCCIVCWNYILYKKVVFI